MSNQLEAVYENGVFRPLLPVQLPEHQRVTVTIQDADSAATIQTHFMLSADCWQAFCAALDAPPRNLPRLKKLLSEASLFDEPGTSAF
jgi:predicted DNA-binding antitoxin AbrB/MazE fold protein